MIDADRFLDDLRTLRTFGAAGTGVIRPSLSPIDMDARQWLCERLTAAGLDARIDGVGNVIGRSPNPGPALLLGSHSDTQPTGGWLDGAYGVIVALEVARALLADEATANLAVDVASWIDEEATFVGCLGSRSFCGLVDPTEIAEARNADGVRLVDAWAAVGLDGEGERWDPGRHVGFLEAHIEQGANLEREGNRIGVVTSIVGSRNQTISFAGQQNHAGTTPMPLRRDAGRALVRFADAIDRAFESMASERTVWTIGRISLEPGAPSIIPGRADLHLQYRDPSAELLTAMERTVTEVGASVEASTGVTVEVEASIRPIDPVPMDASLVEHLGQAAAETAPDRWVEMPSAAIHDAMFLAEVMPAAMLFVPSIDGISHDAAEDTADDDLVLGCETMTRAVARILSSASAPHPASG